MDDLADFALAATRTVTGAALTAVTAVSGSHLHGDGRAPATASGTLGLNLVDNDTVIDVVSTKLGGTGVGNGNFTGQSLHASTGRRRA